MLGWLPAHMFKCVNDCMPTCIDIHMFNIHTHMPTQYSWKVNRLNGITDTVVERTCAQMLWQLCLNIKEIGRLEVCVFGCFNAHMLVYSHEHILVYSHDQMLACSHTSLIICSHVYLLWRSHVHMPTCFSDHMLQCIQAWMFKFFDDHMPTYLYNFMLIRLDNLMIACNYVQMLL